MFGRLYVSAVVLPKEKQINSYNIIKDSKQIKNKQKMKETADFIKQNAIAWSVQFVESNIIDTINIRESVLMTMNKCIDEILSSIASLDSVLILIDGNDFRPYMKCNEETMELTEIPHVTITHGDGLYTSIAAASILAKVSRDEYILDLCKTYPSLIEKYKLNTNMGYGTKDHMDGIKQYGICQWHRRSFGICKTLEPYII